MMGISKDVLIVCCDHNNRGGGVALTVNKKLNPKQIRINTVWKLLHVPTCIVGDFNEDVSITSNTHCCAMFRLQGFK